MTLGERIQSLRKEKGISQEALGELLGVTRQSISKWESDQTIPELDKLIALAKLFGISIGALLGVEEGDAAKELTDRELAALEAIAARLQPRTPPVGPVKKRRKWPWLVAVVLCLLVGGMELSDWANGIQNQIRALQNSNSSLSSTLSAQISNISDQVESILERQNAVTADEAYELVHIDLDANTARYTLRAVPRDYAEGMTAVFTALSKGESVSVPADLDPDSKAFTGTITCPLSNEITLSVAFTANGQTQTRVLGQDDDRLTKSYPWLDCTVGGGLWAQPVQEDKTLAWTAPSIKVYGYSSGSVIQNGTDTPAVVKQVTLRVWKNGELLAELGTLDLDEEGGHWESPKGIRFSDMNEGDTLWFTLRGTDNFGRTIEQYGECFVVKDGALDFAAMPDGSEIMVE